MSHQDYVETVPEGFVMAGHTEECPVAAMMTEEKRFYGDQLHPEVNAYTLWTEHVQQHTSMIYADYQGKRTMTSIRHKTQIETNREKHVGDNKVLKAKSGRRIKPR